MNYAICWKDRYSKDRTTGVTYVSADSEHDAKSQFKRDNPKLSILHVVETELKSPCIGVHSWGEPWMTVTQREAGFSIPKVTVYCWFRVCENCGKIGFTEKFTERIVRTPKF